MFFMYNRLFKKTILKTCLILNVVLYYLKETTYCIANREIYSKNNDYKNYRCYLSISRLWKFQDKQGNLINLGG